MSDSLASKRCVPCEGGVPMLKPNEVRELLTKVPGWSVSAEGKKIHRDWRLKNFVASLEFFQAIGQIAETEQHHPDLHLTGYRNVNVEIWTHAIGGLSENDFILAAKINELPMASQKK